MSALWRWNPRTSRTTNHSRPWGVSRSCPSSESATGSSIQWHLATWHQALSNTVSVEVPHDLMGLWLYPSQGGVVLLGPPELAADDLAIPLPSPHLTSEQLSLIEEIVAERGLRIGHLSADSLRQA